MQREIGPLQVCGDRSLGWFRLFGYGLHWKNISKHRLLFSERNGYRDPFATVGPYWFSVLRPGRSR